MKSKIALITGGAGFIGSHLADRLVREFKEVRIFDNFSTGRLDYLSQARKFNSLKIIEGDVRDQESLTRASESVDFVFHLATHCVRKSLEDPVTNHEVNATGTLNALIAARKCNVKKFIYCSSSEVFGDCLSQESNGALCENSEKKPTTVYGSSKLLGENYSFSFFKTHALPVTVVRPFNSYGPRSHLGGAYGEVIPRFFYFASHGRPVTIFGKGEQTRDFTYVKDTAEGIFRSAQNPSLIGETVHIASGKEISILKLVSEIEKVLKIRIEIKFVQSRPGELQRLWADTQLAEKEVPFKAVVGLNQGLTEYWKWFSEDSSSQNIKPSLVQEVNWNLNLFQ